MQLNFIGLKNTCVLAAVSKKKKSEALTQEVLDEEAGVEKKTPRTSKRSSTRTRKKGTDQTVENVSDSVVDGGVVNDENIATSESIETPKKTRTSGRRKGGNVTISEVQFDLYMCLFISNVQNFQFFFNILLFFAATSTPKIPEEEAADKKVTRRRRAKKQVDTVVDQDSVAEFSDEDEEKVLVNTDDESELEMELQMDGGEDISFTYGWPPLVCCFGAAQHAFVPSGRRANRLIDHEMHERKKNVIWEPEKFVRAPGGCSSNVAVALASLGGKVAFMGKLGDDDFGQSMLYYLNINKVQTRSVRLDSKRFTAVSQMKISKRGGLRMTNVKPCAEDSLLKSEINIDVLREV